MTYDVIIIGAGQAGLTAGYFLKKTKNTFLIIDSCKRISDSWRNRYDSLKLFSPRALSKLPDMKLSGSQDDYPSKDEITDYLESYTEKFALPVMLNTKVAKLEKVSDEFQIKTSNGKEILTKNVIVATGAHPTPFIPGISNGVSNDVFQIHSGGYKNPSQIPGDRILIVGMGNSGAQIAYELSKNNKKVIISFGHNPVFVPKKIFGKSLFWWLKNSGLLTLILSVPTNTFLGKYFYKRQNKLIIGTELKSAIRRKSVITKPRLISLKNNIAIFSDKTEDKIDSIIWATGFRQNFDIIKIPEALSQDSKPRHHRGVSKISGLYFLGLPGLHSIGSGLFSGIANDAEYLINQISGAGKGNRTPVS